SSITFRTNKAGKLLLDRLRKLVEISIDRFDGTLPIAAFKEIAGNAKGMSILLRCAEVGNIGGCRITNVARRIVVVQVYILDRTYRLARFVRSRILVDYALKGRHCSIIGPLIVLHQTDGE